MCHGYGYRHAYVQRYTIYSCNLRDNLEMKITTHGEEKTCLLMTFTIFLEQNISHEPIIRIVGLERFIGDMFKECS